MCGFFSFLCDRRTDQATRRRRQSLAITALLTGRTYEEDVCGCDMYLTESALSGDCRTCSLDTFLADLTWPSPPGRRAGYSPWDGIPDTANQRRGLDAYHRPRRRCARTGVQQGGSAACAAVSDHRTGTRTVLHFIVCSMSISRGGRLMCGGIQMLFMAGWTVCPSF